MRAGALLASLLGAPEPRLIPGAQMGCTCSHLNLFLPSEPWARLGLHPELTVGGEREAHTIREGGSTLSFQWGFTGSLVGACHLHCHLIS
jgi:hypothetical protein